jgi:hypothetical protein
MNYLQTLLGNLVYLYDSLAEHYHLHNNEPIRKRNYQEYVVRIKILTLNIQWIHDQHSTPMYKPKKKLST